MQRRPSRPVSPAVCAACCLSGLPIAATSHHVCCGRVLSAVRCARPPALCPLWRPGPAELCGHAAGVGGQARLCGAHPGKQPALCPLTMGPWEQLWCSLTRFAWPEGRQLNTAWPTFRVTSCSWIPVLREALTTTSQMPLDHSPPRASRVPLGPCSRPSCFSKSQGQATWWHIHARQSPSLIPAGGPQQGGAPTGGRLRSLLQAHLCAQLHGRAGGGAAHHRCQSPPAAIGCAACRLRLLLRLQM